MPWLGTCEASRFDSNSNRKSRFDFDSKVTWQFENFESAAHAVCRHTTNYAHSLFNKNINLCAFCSWTLIIIIRGGTKRGQGAMLPVLGLPPPPAQFPGQWVITKRRAIMICSSTDYLARFNNSNLLQLQLRNYLTLCELIRENRAKLLKDRYCSSVA